MKIITTTDAPPQLGYIKDGAVKGFSFVFVDFLYHTETKRFCIGIGIPYLYAIGFVF